MSPKTIETLTVLIQKLLRKYKGLDISTSHDKNYLHLADLEVPKEKRNRGIGTDVMTKLTKFCDHHKVTMTLQAFSLQSNPDRLVEFYKRFGFYIWNPDKIMVRKPKKLS